MNLPNAHLAWVEKEKITGYLLNSAHPLGAGKARFFVRFGFQVDSWEELAGALLEHGQRNPVNKIKQTGFGPRFEVEGVLRVPDNRHPRVRTVWQIDAGQTAPRLITAYPLEADL